MKLDAFYNLLVKEFISSESKKSAKNKGGSVSSFLENRKDVLAISEQFRHKANFYRAYLSRTILETIVAVALLKYLVYVGLPILSDVRFIKMLHIAYIYIYIYILYR